MQCEKCQTQLPEGAQFCPACGTPAPREETAAPPATPPEAPPAEVPPVATPPAVVAPAPAATQPVDPAAEEYARAQERYQQELAEYERQQAAYQQQYGQVPPPPLPEMIPTFQPPEKKRKTGLIIGIIALVLFLLIGCGAAAVFGLRAFISRQPEIEVFPEDFGEEYDGGSYEEVGEPGYDTPEEALIAQLDEDAMDDWVYEVLEEEDGYVSYAVGPPASEYTLQYFVEQGSDGTWSVTYVVDLSLETETDDAQYLAEDAVWQYMYAVWEDQGLAAQSFTTEPFSSDSASAQESGGGLEDFTVESSTDNGDGSYWVQTTQYWYGSAEQWEYLVIPVDETYKISECRSW